jgi:hypothetical protein
VYPTVVVLVAPLPAIVPPVARIMTLPSVFGARASAAGSAAAASATANTPSPDARSNLRLPRETAVRGEAVCGELEFTMIVGMIGPLFDGSQIPGRSSEHVRRNPASKPPGV